MTRQLQPLPERLCKQGVCKGKVQSNHLLLHVLTRQRGLMTCLAKHCCCVSLYDTRWVYAGQAVRWGRAVFTSLDWLILDVSVLLFPLSYHLFLLAFFIQIPWAANLIPSQQLNFHMCFYFSYLLSWLYFTCFLTMIFSIRWDKVTLLCWHRLWIEDSWRLRVKTELALKGQGLQSRLLTLSEL